MPVLRFAVVLTLNLLIHAPAGAQIAAAQTKPNTRSDQNDPPASESPSATNLDAVIVIGEKSERDVQDTTTSVAVTNAARIEQENLQTLHDVFDRTANVSKTVGNSGFTIRGIADGGNSEGEALATIYLDGAALPQNIVSSGPTGLWDIAQIEVLRGSQSSIQGENALAGAIVLRTQDPSLDSLSGRVRLLYANSAGERNFAFASGGPLIEDELAFRIAAEDRAVDGLVYNPTRDVYEDATTTSTVRSKLLWAPKYFPELTARLSLTKYDYQGPGGFTYVREDRNSRNWFDRRISTSDHRNDNRTRIDVANLEVDYEVNDAWSLSSATAWSDSDSERYNDTDRGPLPESFSNQFPKSQTLSQELRLRHEGERFNGLVGAYLSNRDNASDVISLSNVPTPTATIAALLESGGYPADMAEQIANLYSSALSVVPVDYYADTSNSRRNIALFGDGELRLTQSLSLLAGFRYDRQRYTLEKTDTAAFVGTYPDPAQFGEPGTPLYQTIAAINQGIAGFVADAAGTTPKDTREFKAFLPKLGLRHAFNDDISLALVAQRGYRAGGSTYNTARNEVFAFDPEYTWNYELALRSLWLDNRLSLNANIYYVDWKDKQTTASFGRNTQDFHVVNAGRAHLYGLELEAAHRVSSGFHWYAPHWAIHAANTMNLKLSWVPVSPTTPVANSPTPRAGPRRLAATGASAPVGRPISTPAGVRRYEDGLVIPAAQSRRVPWSTASLATKVITGARIYSQIICWTKNMSNTSSPSPARKLFSVF